MKKQKKQGWRWWRRGRWTAGGKGWSNRARAGRKIEIKGRWVIAVAWEAVGDKSNRSSNRNATPSTDHERKNLHGKSSGINSALRSETHDPDWSNSLVRRERTRAAFSFPLFHHFHTPRSVSFFFRVWEIEEKEEQSIFFSPVLPLSNFKLTDIQTSYRRYFYCIFIERVKCKFIIREVILIRDVFIISKKRNDNTFYKYMYTST